VDETVLLRSARRSKALIPLRGGLLREWLGHREMGKTLVDEAWMLHNLATHRFYDKRGGERGEWHYSAETAAGTWMG
jgi:hypothetical protein